MLRLGIIRWTQRIELAVAFLLVGDRVDNELVSCHFITVIWIRWRQLSECRLLLSEPAHVRCVRDEVLVPSLQLSLSPALLHHWVADVDGQVVVRHELQNTVRQLVGPHPNANVLVALRAQDCIELVDDVPILFQLQGGLTHFRISDIEHVLREDQRLILGCQCPESLLDTS